MPATLSDLIADETLGIRDRKTLRAFYDAAKAAVRAGELKLEGHSLPTTLNDWIARVEPGKTLPKREIDVVDFSFADDGRLARFRKGWTEARRLEGIKPVTLSPAKHQLFARIKALETASQESLDAINGKKDDLVAALSDVQAAVGLLLQAYDGAREALKLPERGVPLERVRVAKARAKKRTDKGSAEGKEAGGGTAKKVRRARKTAAVGEQPKL